MLQSQFLVQTEFCEQVMFAHLHVTPTRDSTRRVSELAQMKDKEYQSRSTKAAIQKTFVKAMGLQ